MLKKNKQITDFRFTSEVSFFTTHVFMITLEKLKGLRTANQLLDEEYGKNGTESRREFNKRALEYARMVENEEK